MDSRTKAIFAELAAEKIAAGLDHIRSFHSRAAATAKDERYLYNILDSIQGEAWETGEIDSTLMLLPGQRVSDVAAELVEHILSSDRTEITAPTGSGKNYALVHCVCPELKTRTGKKSIIVLSLNAKVEQDARQYGVPYITGEAIRQAGQGAKQMMRDAVASDIVLCSQNALPKVIRECREKRHIFIDESHTLVASYRAKPSAALWRSLAGAETVTLLTATAKPYYKLMGFTRLDIGQYERPAIRAEVRRYKGSGADTLITHIQREAIQGKLLVCRMQSKSKLHAIREALIAGGMEPETVVVLTAESAVKAGSDYKNFIQAGASGGDSFGASVRVVLCTSIIGEGLDVYANGKEVAFVNVETRGTFAPDDVVQFADRWRTSKDKTLVSYHPVASPRTVRIDREREFSALWAVAEHEAKRLQRLQDSYPGYYSLQSYFRTRTGFSFSEKFTPGGLPDPLECAATVEALYCENTDTQAGWQHISKCYPWFHVQHEGEAIDAANNAELVEAKDRAKVAGKEAEKVLSLIAQKDTDVFFQAVGSITQDADIRRNTSFHASRREASAELVNMDIFTTHLHRAETFVKHAISLIGQGIDRASALGYLITQDGTHIARQKVSTTLAGLKLHVLLFVYAHMREASAKGEKLPMLTAAQASDADRLERFCTAVQGRTISGRDAHRAMQDAFPEHPNISERRALSLLMKLYNVKTTRKAGSTLHIVGNRRTLKELLMGDIGMSCGAADAYLYKLLDSSILEYNFIPD